MCPGHSTISPVGHIEWPHSIFSRESGPLFTTGRSPTRLWILVRGKGGGGQLLLIIARWKMTLIHRSISHIGFKSSVHTFQINEAIPWLMLSNESPGHSTISSVGHIEWPPFILLPRIRSPFYLRAKPSKSMAHESWTEEEKLRGKLLLISAHWKMTLQRKKSWREIWCFCRVSAAWRP